MRGIHVEKSLRTTNKAAFPERFNVYVWDLCWNNLYFAIDVAKAETVEAT